MKLKVKTSAIDHTFHQNVLYKKGDVHSHDDIRNVVFVLICLYNWNS